MSNVGYGVGGYGVWPSSSTPQTALPPGVSAVFTYRALGPNNDPVWSSYLANAAAVGQAIQTRLLLFLGEWWESLLDGTPYWQKILGVSGQNGQTVQQQISLIIQQRILGSPYVTGITSLQVNFNLASRAFSLTANVQTVFGPTAISYAPQPTAQGIS